MGALNDGSRGNDDGREDSGGSLGGSRAGSTSIEDVGLGTVGCRAGGLGGSRSGAGGLLEGPASYPVSGMTGRPVKGLVYGLLSTTYNCCGFGKFGLVCWLGAAVVG
jgi:hypothetical protein